MNMSQRIISICSGSVECLHRDSISDDDGFLILREDSKLTQADVKQLLKSRHDIDVKLFNADTLRNMDSSTFKNFHKEKLVTDIAFAKELQKRP